MKILYISLGKPDYLCDTILHGLYNLFGEKLTHTNDYYIMYKDKISKESLKKMYGKGFTVWRNLPEYLNDNSDIENKIKNRHFDLVIYGSIHRCKDYINLVKKYYKNNKIVYLDGEDHTGIIKDSCMYFKREKINNYKYLFPISFSIPKEKICDNKRIKKTKNLSDMIPGTKYIYDNEKDYYEGYQKSFFGRTFKKGGWDCMRHYEILANYCLPHFPDLKQCPSTIMTNFPKNEILKSNILFDKGGFGSDEYYDILNSVFEYTKNNLTTECAAKYVINTVMKNK